jgi:hypothetical protein
MELEPLVVPGADLAEEAGKLVKNLPALWRDANLSERRKLLLTMIDGIYIDAKIGKRMVIIKAKPPLRPIFQMASVKEGSKIHIINEPLGSSPKGSVVFLVETGESRTTCDTPLLQFAGC